MDAAERQVRVRALADGAVHALQAEGTYAGRRRAVLAWLPPPARDASDLLLEAAHLCRRRAQRRAQPPQTLIQAAEAAAAQQAAAELLEIMSLDRRAGA